MQDQKQLYQNVVKHLRSGRPKDALMACRTLCEAYPDFAPGWYMASSAAQGMGNLPMALKYVERAVAMAPAEEIFQLRQAHLLLQVGQKSRALDVASKLKGSDAGAQFMQDLGKFYLLAGHYVQACACSKKALQRDPQQPGAWFHLATAQRFLGDLNAAEEAFDRGITIHPEFYEAWYLRSGLRKQTPENNHIDELNAQISLEAKRGLNRDISYLHFALAKELDDLKHYSDSFSALSIGNRRYRSSFHYDVAGDRAVMEAIARHYDTPIDTASDTQNSPADKRPIFILGLPRSGTTLVERILSSHSGVYAAGELKQFALTLSQAVREQAGTPVDRLQGVEVSRQLDFSNLGERYLQACDEFRREAGDRRFIDKMPLNFLYCGLIQKALPEAQIIELVRHPLDVCLAMYKQRFVGAYPFSYSLEETVAYYLAYRRLMNHWHRIMPGKIHRVIYEDLVADQENCSRQLVTACGLSWEEECLNFAANPTASTTASAVQVRQPMYRSSIDKWRHYRDHLQVCIDALNENPDLWNESGRYSLD